MNPKPLNPLQGIYAFVKMGVKMNKVEQSIQEKMEFHERQMNRPELDSYWREKSEQLYWHYLDLLTKPEAK